jgi:N-acyl-D-aspartate/D-glutamate deacylase
MSLTTKSFVLVRECCISSFLFDTSKAQEVYDLVVLNGRVIDPESKLDAVRNLGISGGVIKVITRNQLNGRNVINAKGLTVSPGFIDLHQHGHNPENYRFKAMDGVTTALELEVGTGDVDRWYGEREGKAQINYGMPAQRLERRVPAMKNKGRIRTGADADLTIFDPERVIDRSIIKSRQQRPKA